MKIDDKYIGFGIDLQKTPQTLRYYKDKDGVVKVDLYRNKNEYVTGKVVITKEKINFNEWLEALQG